MFTQEDPRSALQWQAPRRLYLNAAGQVVEEGDPTKATLLVREGGYIPLTQARALGLVQDAPAPEAKAVPAPPQNKAVAGPAKTKDK